MSLLQFDVVIKLFNCITVGHFIRRLGCTSRKVIIWLVVIWINITQCVVLHWKCENKFFPLHVAALVIWCQLSPFYSFRYFGGYGIIRDIVHSHVLQTIALLAMEPPVSLDGEDIRNEKVHTQIINSTSNHLFLDIC